MSTPLTLETKNVISIKVYLKQGRDPALVDMRDFTFNDVVLPDGTELKDLTFAQLQDTVWSLENKNVTTLTDEPKS